MRPISEHCVGVFGVSFEWRTASAGIVVVSLIGGWVWARGVAGRPTVVCNILFVV